MIEMGNTFVTFTTVLTMKFHSTIVLTLRTVSIRINSVLGYFHIFLTFFFRSTSWIRNRDMQKRAPNDGRENRHEDENEIGTLRRDAWYRHDQRSQHDKDSRCRCELLWCQCVKW